MFLIMIGTKAQLIKMAPIMKEMERQDVPYRFVLTGQHKETINDIIEAFGIRSPDFELVKLREADTSIRLLGWLMKALFYGVFPRKNENFWKGEIKASLVHGDTLSTLVATVLSRLRGIPVGHIEAGLRSFDYFHPFPEEIVRILVGKLSNYFFCQDDWSFQNLKKLSKKKIKINTQGNTLVDGVNLALSSPIEIKTPDVPYAIYSIHRFENLSNKDVFNFIMNQLFVISKKIHILFVVHPTTREKLKSTDWWKKCEENVQITLLPRTDYVRFIKLLNGSQFLITDGGSNQEECAYLKLPCLLMRKKTERQDGLNDTVVLSNYDPEVIQDFVDKYHSEKDHTAFQAAASDVHSPSKAIVDYLKTL